MAQWERIYSSVEGRGIETHSMPYSIGSSEEERVINGSSKITVDLSEWSKEPGLGPGMFACAGSNPVVNNLINYKISSMNFIIFSLYKL